MVIEPGTELFVHPEHAFRDSRLRPRRISPDGMALPTPRPDVPINVTYTIWDNGNTIWDGGGTVWDATDTYDE